MKLVIAEGAFDSFEGTQEELDALIAKIQEMINQPDFESKSTPLTEEESQVILRRHHNLRS
jgi:hypothetical protein